MVEAGPILRSTETAGKDAGDDRVRGAGELDGSGGRADLVVDDGEAVALARKAKHGEQEIVAMGTIDPAGAEDEEFAANAFHGLFARQLACAINIERIRRVRLDPRRGFAAVKNVIGGVVDKKGVAPEGFFGEDTWRLLVDGVGEIALGFGAIDRSVGGSVQNDIGRVAANQVASLLGIGEVDGFAVNSDNGAESGKDLFELATELAGVADDEDAGSSWPWLAMRSCGRAPEIVEVCCWHFKRPLRIGKFASNRDSPYNLKVESSPMRRVYCDANATTPLLPEVMEAMRPYLDGGVRECFVDSFAGTAGAEGGGPGARDSGDVFPLPRGRGGVQLRWDRGGQHGDLRTAARGRSPDHDIDRALGGAARG